MRTRAHCIVRNLLLALPSVRHSTFSQFLKSKTQAAKRALAWNRVPLCTVSRVQFLAKIFAQRFITCIIFSYHACCLWLIVKLYSSMLILKEYQFAKFSTIVRINFLSLCRDYFYRKTVLHSVEKVFFSCLTVCRTRFSTTKRHIIMIIRNRWEHF